MTAHPRRSSTWSGRAPAARAAALIVALVAVLTVSVLAVTARAAPSRRLVVYSAAPLAFTESIKRDFEAENPGVTVEILSGLGGEAMVTRLEAEKASPRADVMHSGAVFEFVEATKKGLLAPTRPREIAGVAPANMYLGGQKIPLFDAEGRWYVYGFSLGVIGYNRDRLAALRLPAPRSWADLANPVYKGHVVFNMPQLSSSAFNTVVALYQVMGPRNVWTYWDRISDNVAFYSRSTSALYTLVGRGEVPISFGVARPYYEGQMRGQAVEVVYPTEGAWVFATAMGVVNGAPNADLARTFMKWKLSASGQRNTVNNFQNPVRAGIRPTEHNVDLSVDALIKQVPKLIVVDLEVAERIRAEVMRRFEAYTSGRAR
jgi:iron(III) transport system substrate-binding protein